MSLQLRSYLILAFIAIIGIVGQWSDEYLRDMWRYLGAVYLLILLYDYYLVYRAKLHLHQEVPASCHLGRELHAYFTFSNPSRFSLHIKAQQTHVTSLINARPIYDRSIDSLQSVDFDFSLIPQSLGQHPLPDIYTQCSGPLKLVWWNRRFSSNKSLLVKPDRLHNYEYRAGSELQGQRLKRKTGGGMELLGIRDYDHGDPLRSIDWKATARSGRTKTRVFSEELHMEAILLLDCGFTSNMQAGKLSRLNHYINTAARLAQKAIANGDKVGVVTYADRVIDTLLPVSGMRGLQQIRDVLARTEAQSRESSPLNSVLQLRQQLRQRSMVVMFCDTDDADATNQLLMCAQLLRPKHLPIFASIYDEDIDNMMHQAANNWLDPFYCYSAMELTSASKKLALRLQRLGCHIVHKKSEHLDSAVMTHYDHLRSLV